MVRRYECQHEAFREALLSMEPGDGLYWSLSNFSSPGDARSLVHYYLGKIRKKYTTQVVGRNFLIRRLK